VTLGKHWIRFLSGLWPGLHWRSSWRSPDSVIGWGILGRCLSRLGQGRLQCHPLLHPTLAPSRASGLACQQVPIFLTKNAFWQDVDLRQTSQRNAFYFVTLGKHWNRPELRPGPQWGSSRRSPRFRSRLGMRKPLPHSPSLDDFSIFGSVPSALRTSMPLASPFSQPILASFWIRACLHLPISEPRMHENGGFCIIDIFFFDVRNPYHTHSCALRPKLVPLRFFQACYGPAVQATPVLLQSYLQSSTASPNVTLDDIISNQHF